MFKSSSYSVTLILFRAVGNRSICSRNPSVQKATDVVYKLVRT